MNKRIEEIVIYSNFLENSLQSHVYSHAYKSMCIQIRLSIWGDRCDCISLRPIILLPNQSVRLIHDGQFLSNNGFFPVSVKIMSLSIMVKYGLESLDQTIFSCSLVPHIIVFPAENMVTIWPSKSSKKETSMPHFRTYKAHQNLRTSYCDIKQILSYPLY
jgi:hypothetical protein